MFRRTADRLSTGVEGLDRILCGGLLRPSSYLLAGGPGTGKTVLGSQMAFKLASLGQDILFISVLTEPYSHLLWNISTFSFFDEARINKQITFVSAFSTLEAQGLSGLEEMMRLSLPGSGAALVILDNIGMLSGYAGTPLDYRAFLQKTISLSTMSGATVVASTDRPISTAATEYGSFDGVIELRQCRRGMRTFRTLEVLKSRGSFHLEGEHAFEIGLDGLVVYPRLEVGWKGRPPDLYWPGSLSWGIPGLDEMTGGGVGRGTVTALVGPTGAGKTTFCMSFAGEGILRGEKVLFVSHHESPRRLMEAAKGVGLDLDLGLRTGLFETMWLPPGEDYIDRMADEVLKRLDRRPVTRLILDGSDSMRRLSLFRHRFAVFMAIFCDQLRGRGVTTLLTTGEAPRNGRIADEGLPWSSIDNILHILYDADAVPPRKVLHVAKTRGRGHGPSAGELEITESGVRIVPLPTPQS